MRTALIPPSRPKIKSLHLHAHVTIISELNSARSASKCIPTVSAYFVHRILSFMRCQSAAYSLPVVICWHAATRDSKERALTLLAIPGHGNAISFCS